MLARNSLLCLFATWSSSLRSLIASSARVRVVISRTTATNRASSSTPEALAIASSTGNSRPDRSSAVSSRTLPNTGASPLARYRARPARCALRYVSGMIVSARTLPRTSSRVQPNVTSACGFQSEIRPISSMPTIALSDVSTIACKRAWDPTSCSLTAWVRSSDLERSATTWCTVSTTTQRTATTRIELAGCPGFAPPVMDRGQNPDRGQPGRCPDLVTGVIKGSEQNGGEVQREDEEHGRNCIARRGDDRLDYEHRGDPAEHRSYVNPARKPVPGHRVAPNDHHIAHHAR